MCHAESCARSVPSASFAMHENMPFLRLTRTFRDCERFVDGPDAALSAPARATAVRPAQKSAKTLIPSTGRAVDEHSMHW